VVEDVLLLLLGEFMVCSGGEESYLLLEGASRRRSRLRTWADGRPRHLLFRPYWWIMCGCNVGLGVRGNLSQYQSF
jgi:hypothetical protein